MSKNYENIKDYDLSDWEQEGFESEKDFERYIKNILRLKPPAKQDFSNTKVISILNEDGTRSTKTVMIYRSGVPRIVTTSGHHVDTWWEYPEIGTSAPITGGIDSVKFKKAGGTSFTRFTPAPKVGAT